MSENRRFMRFADENPLNEQPGSLEAADLSIFGGEHIERKSRVPENALVRREDGALIYKQFVLSPVGIDIPYGTEIAEWEDVGGIIRKLESAASWLVGDWAAYAYDYLGMSYEEIAEKYGYALSTIETYVSICRAIPGLIRNQTVALAHHRLVVKLPEHQQRYWLNEAAAHRWTVKEMKAAMFPGKGKVKPAGEEKRLRDSIAFIKAQKSRKSAMKDWQRDEYADCALWLAEYFYREAQSVRGDSDQEYSGEYQEE